MPNETFVGFGSFAVMNFIRSAFRASLGFLCVSALFFGACSKEQPKPALRVLCKADSFDQESVARFEQEKNCSVELVVCADDLELFNRLMDGNDCDLAVAPADLTEEFMKSGKLVSLSLAELPTVTRNIDARFLDVSFDPGMDHSVPYRANFLGIAYLPDAVPNFQFSWTTFSRPDLKEKTAASDDMRETIGAALLILGYDPNTVNEKEIARASGVVRAWRDNGIRFLSAEETAEALDKEFLAAAMLFHDDAIRAAKKNPKLAFCHPEEGSILRLENFVVPTGSLQKNLALEFVNHFYRPEIAAASMTNLSCLMPNGPAMATLPAPLRDSPAYHVSDSLLEGARVHRTLPRKNNNIYRLYWTALQTE